MKRRSSSASVPGPGSLRLFGLTASLLLALGTGCPGSLEGTWPSAGSGGNGGGTGGAGGTVACDGQMIIQGCHIGCHNSTSSSPDLQMPNVRTRLTTVTAMTSTAPCMGQPIVNAANPSSSVILQRIMGGSCGNQMPLGLSPLSSSDQACVATYIMTP